MSNENKVGQNLFATSKKSNKKGQYKQPIVPNELYDGIKNSISLSKERGTFRVPLEQKLEIDALLQVSTEYKYVYELLAELVFERVSTFSKSDRDKYNNILSDLKEKEIKKLERKANKSKWFYTITHV